jgi:hypothetical protein
MNHYPLTNILAHHLPLKAVLPSPTGRSTNFSITFDV